MFSSVSRTLAAVLALSAATGCAVSADNADATPPPLPAEDNVAVKNVGVPAGPEEALVDMASSLLESLLGEGVSALFPSEGIDYDRLAADYKAAAQQADLDQTLLEQARAVDGKAVALAEDQVAYATGKANVPQLISLLEQDQDQIAGMLTTLSDPKLAQAGLAAYISGAQIKLNIWGFLIVLDPEHADSYRADLAYDAKMYFDQVTKVKTALVQQGKQARMDQFTACAEHDVVTPYGSYPDGWNFQDGGTNYHFGDVGSCNDTRNRLWYGAGANKIIEMQTSLQWIDTMLNAWQTIALPNTVSVTSATYGASCNATPNNVTTVIGLACNGQTNCSYTVQAANLGDQAVGCAKDFQVNYICAGITPTVRTVTLPPEAQGHTVQLTCP